MGYEHYIFAEAIASKFVCAFCQKVYFDAKSGPCGHILCTNCWIINADATIDCPLCPQTQKIEANTLINEGDINQVISSFKTCCKYRGCTEHILLQEREEHIKVCKHKDTKESLVISDMTSCNTEASEEERERKKIKRIKILCIKLGLTLCIYAMFAVAGVVPDRARMRIPFCGVDGNDQLLQDIEQ